MVKDIVRDVIFLSQKCGDATPADVPILTDMLDTISANSNICIGLAANMIGVAKRIIVVQNGNNYYFMLNPEIIEKYNPYPTQEGCLSHVGLRPTIRYKIIKVRYFDPKFKMHEDVFTDVTAQAIQHEIDHCNGIII